MHLGIIMFPSFNPDTTYFHAKRTGFSQCNLLSVVAKHPTNAWARPTQLLPHLQMTFATATFTELLSSDHYLVNDNGVSLAMQPLVALPGVEPGFSA